MGEKQNADNFSKQSTYDAVSRIDPGTQKWKVE